MEEDSFLEYVLNVVLVIYEMVKQYIGTMELFNHVYDVDKRS